MFFRIVVFISYTMVGETGENLPKCCFVCYKSYMEMVGIESGTPVMIKQGSIMECSVHLFVNDFCHKTCYHPYSKEMFQVSDLTLNSNIFISQNKLQLIWSWANCFALRVA